MFFMYLCLPIWTPNGNRECGDKKLWIHVGQSSSTLWSTEGRLGLDLNTSFPTMIPPLFLCHPRITFFWWNKMEVLALDRFIEVESPASAHTTTAATHTVTSPSKTAPTPSAFVQRRQTIHLSQGLKMAVLTPHESAWAWARAMQCGGR
jgi:hypothetical protein